MEKIKLSAEEIDKLRYKLTEALVHYKTKTRYKHYHCNEQILSDFKENIRTQENPSEDSIMRFVICLEAFYDAGLRYEKDKSGVERMTSFIKDNWKAGINIYDQINTTNVNPSFIEDFIKKVPFKRKLYSFITKFYHQFNSDYPIYDSKLQALMYLLFPENKKSLYKSYVEYYRIYMELLKQLSCNMSINDFDNAAWILMKEKGEELKGEKITIQNLLN